MAGLWLLLVVAWMIRPARMWISKKVIWPVIIVPRHTQSNQAKYVLGDFYHLSKAGKYKAAHELLSRDLQKSISADGLRKQWGRFIAKHGRIRNWAPPGGGTISFGQTSLWPKWVRFKHQIVGSKKTSGNATVRLSPEGGAWRIDELTISP
ncbi:MAG: hypothetical protein JWN98_2402 [Abditibacteriota bacterium]|nr:hypothetical protein [Abditibacteriota bacterium]